ncbi:MAG TPA: hypothetical protein PLJ10_12390, partial [Candidatus Hydrogenedens sp.]|nr:hypothetical protein [Candidatus Hydrogenedens sp.]
MFTIKNKHLSHREHTGCSDIYEISPSLLPSIKIIVSTDENELTTEGIEERIEKTLWFSVHSVVKCSLPCVIAKYKTHA